MTPFGGDPDTNLHLIRAQWERTFEDVARSRLAPALAHDAHHTHRRGRLFRWGRTIVAYVMARAPRSTVPARPAEPDSIALIRPMLVRLETCDGAYHTGECIGRK